MPAVPAQSDHDILIRLDEKVDSLHKKVDSLTDDHENRIRGLEQQANRFLGRQSMVGVIVGGIAISLSLVEAFISAGKLF